MKVTEQSMLTLGFGYYREGDSTVWDLTKLYLNEDRYKYNGIEVTRNVKAGGDADEKYSDHWKRLMEEGKPYDLKTYLIRDNTAIGTVYKNVPKTGGGSDFSVLYDVMLIKTGVVDQDDMESSMKKNMQNLVVYER
jgi:serine protease Do